MTSGTKTRDERATVVRPWTFTATDGDPPCSSSGTQTYDNMGKYWQKTWSGGNAPSGQRRRSFTLESVRYTPVSYDEKTGKYIRAKKPRTYTYRVYKSSPPAPRGEHDYSMTLTDQEVQPCLVLYRATTLCGGNIRTGDRFIYDDKRWGLGLPSDAWNSNDTISLIGKFGEKVNGANFNILVTLGEARESVHTITDGARRIARALYYVKRGNVFAAAEQLFLNPKRHIKSVKHLAQDATSQWLGLRYGWRPMLNDIWSAAKHLAFALNRDIKQTFRASLKKQGKLVGFRAPKEPASGDWRTNGKIKAIVTRGNPLIAMGLTNPAAVAWELMPLSFVGDWMLPISDYLTAQSVSSALTATYVTTVFKEWNTNQTYGTDKTNGGIYSCFFRNRNVSVSRTVSTTLSVPLPTWKSPLETGSPVKRCIDAIALVFQRSRLSKG